MHNRFLWAVAGIASSLLGLLGLVVPIFPGFIFPLLAFVCFSRAVKPPTKPRAASVSLVDDLRADMHHQYRRLARYARRRRTPYR